jgi:hypothetical protein
MKDKLRISAVVAYFHVSYITGVLIETTKASVSLAGLQDKNAGKKTTGANLQALPLR